MSEPCIAYVTDQRLPNTVATSEQVLNMSAALAAGGARLDLLIPRRLPEPDPATLRAELAAYYGVEPSFELVYLPELPLSAPGVRKAVHGLLAAVLARRRPYDVLYTRTVLPAVLGAAMGQQVVLETYHVLDRHRPRTARLLAWLSRSPNLLGIVAHSALARDSLLRAGVEADRVAVFRNGFNQQMLSPELSTTEARRHLGWNQDERIVVYTGRVDVDKGALTILELATRTPEITYVAISDSERVPADWLIRVAAARGCDNVRWYPAVPPSELGPYLYAADKVSKITSRHLVPLDRAFPAHTLVQRDCAADRPVVVVVRERQTPRHWIVRRLGVRQEVSELPAVARVVRNEMAVFEEQRDGDALMVVLFRCRELPQ